MSVIEALILIRDNWPGDQNLYDQGIPISNFFEYEGFGKYSIRQPIPKIGILKERFLLIAEEIILKQL